MLMSLKAGANQAQLDAWDGYSYERKMIVDYVLNEKIPGLVAITGDIHTFVAGDVRLNDTDKRALATEFVGGSISAPGLGEGGGGVLGELGRFTALAVRHEPDRARTGHAALPASMRGATAAIRSPSMRISPRGRSPRSRSIVTIAPAFTRVRSM